LRDELLIRIPAAHRDFAQSKTRGSMYRAWCLLDPAFGPEFETHSLWSVLVRSRRDNFGPLILILGIG